MGLAILSRTDPGSGPIAVWDDERPRILGRSPSCDIIIAGRGVSKRHCFIARRGGIWMVDDLGSANGTRLNGRVVATSAPLRHGDEITLGVEVLTVHIETDEDQDASLQASFAIREAAGRDRVLAEPGLVIGRRADCGLVITDRGVSRRHCEIRRLDDGFRIRDLESRNGTFVNGERIVTRLLASGDRVFLGDPGEGIARTAIEIEIAAWRCHLAIERPNDRATTSSGRSAVHAAFAAAIESAAIEPSSAEPSTVSASAVRRAQPAEVAPLTAAARRQEAMRESSELSRVIPTLARHKARYRGGKWVPTSDLLPHRGRQAATLAAFLAVFAAGAILTASGNLRPAPGPLASVHDGDAFHSAHTSTGGSRSTTCRACHTPFAGVGNAACLACHPSATIAPPHNPPTLTASGTRPLRCAGCHLEHRGDPSPTRPARRAPAERLVAVPHPAPALPVERSACLACHPAAHTRLANAAAAAAAAGGATETLGAATGLVFLNVFFSSTWVHTLHLARPPCASCHQSRKDQVIGTVTTACAGCHGGATAAAVDGNCLSCHYLHKSGPLLPRPEPRRSGATPPRQGGTT